MPSLTVYIDEAGDAGVRDGFRYFNDRHEWLAISALIIRTSRERATVDWVRDLRQQANIRQKPILHYSEINRSRRAQVCQSLARKPIRALTIVTHKTNMRMYENPILGRMTDPKKFYNWCMRLLFERVMEWCGAWQLDQIGKYEPLQVVFSENKGHGYDHMFAYFDKLTMQYQATGMHLRPRCWIPALAERTHWSVEPHSRLAGLQLADVVASAFYQAANTVSPAWDAAPAQALKPIMAEDAKKRTADFGVTVWPLPHQAAFPLTARPIFEFYGYTFS